MPSAFASISTPSSASAGTLNVNVNVSDRPTGSDSMNHNPSLLIVLFVSEIVMKRIMIDLRKSACTNPFECVERLNIINNRSNRKLGIHFDLQKEWFEHMRNEFN
jgi:hypothetical protein